MTNFTTCTPSQLSQVDFVAVFADIYEHSAWVAETVYQQGISTKFDNIATLHLRMSEILLSAPHNKQLALINAHPDLAGRAAINILADFERRIHNDLDTEFNQALLEINKIAGFRLNDL